MSNLHSFQSLLVIFFSPVSKCIAPQEYAMHISFYTLPAHYLLIILFLELLEAT